MSARDFLVCDATLEAQDDDDDDDTEDVDDDDNDDRYRHGDVDKDGGEQCSMRRPVLTQSLLLLLPAWLLGAIYLGKAGYAAKPPLFSILLRHELAMGCWTLSRVAVRMNVIGR